MTKRYTDAEYKAMENKLCYLSNTEGICRIALLAGYHPDYDKPFFDGDDVFESCVPIPYDEAMRYIYQPDPETLTDKRAEDFASLLKISVEQAKIFIPHFDALNKEEKQRFFQLVCNDAEPPVPSKRTKDNLFVGMKKKWKWAAFDIRGQIVLFAGKLPPVVCVCHCGHGTKWGRYDESLCWFSDVYNIVPWVDINKSRAWQDSLIERPEGM